jgi:hypothetical protein
MSEYVIEKAPVGEEGFLDEKELLKRIPVSRRTLANWKSKGFPYIKIGRRCIYSWPNCQAYLLRQQRNGGESV